MLLSAGCTGPSSPDAGTDNGTALPSVTPTDTSTDASANTPVDTPANISAAACSFEHLTGRTDTHLSMGDSCYFETHTPVEFLNDLRMHPNEPVMVLDVPEGWITHEDAELLMHEIDSEEPAAPVVSPISSYCPENQTSTVGNEALFLLEGYRAGKYPPALCSLYYFNPNRTGMALWWNTTGQWE
ncbi:hypothetical protein AZH53_00775 [Methanomicrobiaceae archaeon CYW5]|nr:hypothetical protein [Methanovulcanius yangii]